MCETDNILVVDTNTLEIIRSNIKCPEKAQYHACMVPKNPLDNLLIIGYVKQFQWN